ncbi:glycosyltransferase family 2 protein [Clostridium perfringens]|uniref:glycosyltransferase family 2 protein n=1 Tax=Clostridium perfringens TaxID=1502 RepID=UPI001A287FD8|nr:glycosyltransferase family 2 protein [Clostridium perfringens]UBK71823.1 glycosyltransferase family 2 protein [Clostridium perfringens]HAT4134361.1 glycosyltransferase family 2 protein [Clostridium perfringens]HAT4149656.1 glycosyltransferase family 2 protein [Clostridium perfringens]
MLDVVSVIVPVYNVEKYISKCIESIKNQTYKNIEIIFVDDGSNDNSRKIISGYMNLDKRIKYLYQHNRGPSVARNKGIDEAKGDFIIFVDSDDWINTNMIEDMLAEMKKENADIAICDYILETEKKSIYSDTLSKLKEINSNSIKDLLVCSDTLNSQCNRLYKKKIIFDNKIRFDEGLTVGEDQIFNMEYITHTKNIAYIQKGFYHYRMVSNSTCRKVHKNQIEMLEKQQEIRNRIISKWGMYDKFYRVKSAKWFLQNISAYCYLASITLNKKECRELISKFVNNKTTKESLSLVNKQKIEYQSNIHKIFIPLIKLGSSDLIFIVSKIFYLLNYLKDKLIRGSNNE